jgi:Uma2 family endonuclease
MPTTFTRADYDRLPEGFPAQLIEGFLVKQPAPTYGHQALVLELALKLVARVGRPLVVTAPSDVVLDDHNVYQPDVLVLRAIPPLHVRDVGIPLLAIEVLSSSTARHDRRVKRKHLLAAGVAEMLDPDSRTVELDDATGHRVASGEETMSSTAVPGFALTSATLFEAPQP